MDLEATKGLSQNSFTLPYLINHKNKLVYLVGMWIIGTFIYMTSNHYPIFPPQLLPMSWIDDMIPFVPDTIFIYVSEYLMFFVVYFSIKKEETLSKLFFSFAALQVTAVAIFFIWPTTFPRDLFPLTGQENILTYTVFTWLRETDTPNNCLPSLHVASCYLCALAFLDENRKKFWFFFIWATLVGFATLTTKQHYIADVIAGLAMATLMFWFFHRFTNWRPSRPSDEAN